MITDNDNKIKNDMKYIHINDSDTFEWVVNACLKSRLHGRYVLRNKMRVSAGAIEPVGSKENLYTVNNSYKYKMILKRGTQLLWLTAEGRIWANREDDYDVVGFQIS